ncbi:MAG: 3-isopropylmalate dehydratase small subunit [Gaiellaceae bacterium]
MSTFEGRAVVIDQDNVDTDVLYPGAFLNITDPDQMKNHLFEGLDPSLRDQLAGDTVLVVGENFGMGSSREHVPQAMKAADIRCVLGRSFARIFERNCVNLGLMIVVSPEAAAAASPGSQVAVDPHAGTVEVDGVSYDAPPLPTFMLEMVESGGLVNWVQRRLSA